MSPIALKVHELSVRYGNHEVIHRVSFLIPAGQIVAITGSNGSGKTTLLKGILGIVAATGVREIFTKPPAEWEWKRIGYVPQRIAMQPGVESTVLEVVSSGALAGWKLFKRRGVKRLAVEKLSAVGLAERACTPFKQLSGGQQQRVLIARALMRDPDLLFMDEPLSGIDVESAETLARIVLKLRDDGKTVVMVLHELGPFRNHLDQLITLSKGQILTS